ncbi:MAG TPA: hypothetical protein VIL22_00855 [Paenibacillaceae bacterium]
MDDLKEAYKVLGLPEDADRETVEKRYFILLRQARARQMRGEPAGTDPACDPEAIDRAYRLIVAEEERKERERLREQLYGKDEKAAERKAKIEHFFHYYKFHLLGAILLVAFIIYGVNAWLDQRAEQRRLASLPPPDLEIHFVGAFWPTGENRAIEDVEPVVLDQFPGWQRVVARLSYVPQEMQSGQDYAFAQKLVIDLIQYKPDVFILDEPHFSALVSQGIFKRLDDPALGGLADAIPEALKRMAQAEEDPAPALYGVDISGSPLLEEWPVTKRGPVIAAVRVDTARPDKAREFIGRLLEGQAPGS